MSVEKISGLIETTVEYCSKTSF